MESLFLGNIDLDHAIKTTYSNNVLKRVHGNNVRLSPWNKNNTERRLEYNMHLNEVPVAIRTLLMTNNINVCCNQKVMYQDEFRHEVENKVKLDCMGSRLVSIQPRFILHRNDQNETFFTAMVKVNIWAPQPIKGIAENFMIIQAEKEILEYGKAILDNI
jgi:hypothetical protein